jgi:HKD family nuclease
MLYYKNLYDHVLVNTPRDATDIYVLSGYLGFKPIEELSKTGIKSTIINGLFKETQNKALHEQLTMLHSDSTKIYYPSLSSHAKCYLWMNENKLLRALVGSANFSSNGLNNDYREVLFEVDKQQIGGVKAYIDVILETSKECTEYKIQESITGIIADDLNYDPNIAKIELYDIKTGETQEKSGLNWGLGKGNVKPDDAYIPIRQKDIKRYKDLFPPRKGDRASGRDANEVIEALWDDGFKMQCKLEGSQSYEGKIFPKQIASSPTKEELGIYLRKRLGLNSGERVTRNHLMTYGSDSVKISLISEGVYFIDFSPSKS